MTILRPRPSRRPLITSAEKYVGAELGMPESFLPLHQSEIVLRRPPRHHNGDSHPLLTALAEWCHPATFRAQLPGARVVGQDAIVLTHDYRALIESTFGLEALRSNRAFQRRVPRGKVLEGRYGLLSNLWARAHFHWLLDTLPRLALLPDDIPLLIPANLSPAARESLALCGVGEDRLVELQAPHVVVESLEFPSLVGGTGNPPRWVVHWLRDRLVPGPQVRDRRIYVSRDDAGWRHVENEPEVRALLDRHGFEPILLAELPLAEQLLAFAEAEAVVGPHGGGFSSLFAATDATVIEIFGEGYMNGCFYALADAADLDYWYLVVKDTSRNDLQVDLSALEATLVAAGLA